MFDGVSLEQILGCCLFLRLFQGKLSTGERERERERESGREESSDKWCLCVRRVVVPRGPAMEILICIGVQVGE